MHTLAVKMEVSGCTQTEVGFKKLEGTKESQISDIARLEHTIFAHFLPFQMALELSTGGRT